jgi:hypothetical protein
MLQWRQLFPMTTTWPLLTIVSENDGNVRAHLRLGTRLNPLSKAQ